MYYKEEWINGQLCWKSTPDGEWIPFTIGQYKDRVLQLEAEVKKFNIASVVRPEVESAKEGELLGNEAKAKGVSVDWCKCKGDTCKNYISPNCMFNPRNGRWL